MPPLRRPRWPSAQVMVDGVAARRRILLVGLAGAVGHLVALLAIPAVGQRAIDSVVAGGESFASYAAALVALGVLRAASGGLRKYQASKLMAAVGADVRARLFDRLQSLSFDSHDRIGTGQLMSRASSDVTALEAVLGPIPFIAESALLGVGGLVLMTLLDPLLAAAVLVVVSSLGFVTLRRARPLHLLAGRVQEAIGAFAQLVEQQVGGIRVVKGHGFEGVHAWRARKLAGEARATGIDLVDGRARFVGAAVLVPGAAMLAVLGLGGWRGATGAMSAGEVFAFAQYLALMMAPIMTGAHLLVLWPRATASAARIAEVLALEPGVSDQIAPATLPAGPGDVRFENVRFGYEPGRLALDGVDLDIRGGTSVALVGPSGSGKSTLALLVPRFFDPSGGRILLDGTSIDRLALVELRAAVAIVFEDTVVFTASIRDNIAIGRPSATDAEVRRAASLAQAHRFIHALPDGYDSMIGEQGASLSGGQRQRLAVARAILRDPRVLILDDATSALDPVTDEALRRALREVMRDRTTLVVAHRVETLALVDRVVMIDDGRVVADGTHDELSALPVYRATLALDAVPVAR